MPLKFSKSKQVGRKVSKTGKKVVQVTKKVRRPIKKIGKWAKKDAKVFKKSIGDCERCSVRRELDHHHVIGRANKHMRYMKENLIMLCRECHQWAELNPRDFMNWFKAVYADRYQIIEKEKNILDV